SQVKIFETHVFMLLFMISFLFFHLFDFTPVFLQFFLTGKYRVSKYMRMTPYHFPADSIDHLMDRKNSYFCRDLSMHYNLKQNIPQFLLKILHILIPDGIHRFLTFFFHTGNQRLMSLLLIPRTSSLTPEV